MNDIETVAAKTAGALQHSFNRLSVTQQIMLRGIGLIVVLVLVCGTVGAWAPPTVGVSDGNFYTGTAVISGRRNTIDSTSGEIELARLWSHRATTLRNFATRYGVDAELTQLIYDIALQEGIDPDLGFRIVNVESGFKARATSRASAYGLTQVQVATARFYDSDITMEGLFEPATNLRIGFRYLRDLLETYGDVNLALLAYNRGPSRVKDLMEAGRNPDNGYPGVLMEGYTGGMP